MDTLRASATTHSFINRSRYCWLSMVRINVIPRSLQVVSLQGESLQGVSLQGESLQDVSLQVYLYRVHLYRVYPVLAALRARLNNVA